MHAKFFLNKFLTEENYFGISQSIVNAYTGCNEFIRNTPAIGAFLIGDDLRPHLLRVFTEHALMKYADVTNGFSHEIRKNEAKNCMHLRLYKNGLALSAHYMGRNCERPYARNAINKAILADRNESLFDFEDREQDKFSEIGYAQIMHGGMAKPEEIFINIPTRDQQSIVAALSLEIPSPNKAQVEEVQEEVNFKLKAQASESQNGNQ